MKIFYKPILKCSLSFLMFSTWVSIAWGLTDTARNIYERHSDSVYQIQIIDINSGEKSVIGSGFSFSQKGLFATNYHVVSDVVDTPNRYRIEYHKGSEKKGELILLAIDVAHDLAILKGEGANTSSLTLGSSNRLKGDRVYPMGNPLDLGMTIIEGTFNGLVGVDPYQHILLSAPLNPGMSGGPAFSSSGKVIGVNVAIEGNDLSYLVPVEYLIKLSRQKADEKGSQNWIEIIQAQLLKRYDRVIEKIINAKLSDEKFGSLKVPQNMLPSGIKCWGDSRHEDLEDGSLYSFGRKRCRSEYDVYLSSEMSTGTIEYSIIWMESEALGSLEFYKKYSSSYSKSLYNSYVTEKEVSEFSCSNKFIKLADHDWKAAYCVRRYNRFQKLYDVSLNLAVLGESKRGHVIRVGLGGIDEKLAKRFLRKLLGGIQWID